MAISAFLLRLDSPAPIPYYQIPFEGPRVVVRLFSDSEVHRNAAFKLEIPVRDWISE